MLLPLLVIILIQCSWLLVITIKKQISIISLAYFWNRSCISFVWLLHFHQSKFTRTIIGKNRFVHACTKIYTSIHTFFIIQKDDKDLIHQKLMLATLIVPLVYSKNHNNKLHRLIIHPIDRFQKNHMHQNLYFTLSQQTFY